MPQVPVSCRCCSVLGTCLERDRIGSTYNTGSVSLPDPPFRSQLVSEAFKTRRRTVHFFAVPFTENVVVKESLCTCLEPFGMLQVLWKQNVLNNLSFQICTNPEQAFTRGRLSVTLVVHEELKTQLLGGRVVPTLAVLFCTSRP